jgi:hypothetical protein
MRNRLLLLWLLLPFLMLLASPLAAHADADGACAHNGRDACYVWTAEVRGHVYAGSQEDLTTGSRASTDVAAAERTARITAASAYSSEVLHEVMSGNFSPDGVDPAFSVRPSEVRVISVEKRH